MYVYGRTRKISDLENHLFLDKFIQKMYVYGRTRTDDLLRMKQAL